MCRPTRRCTRPYAPLANGVAARCGGGATDCYESAPAGVTTAPGDEFALRYEPSPHPALAKDDLWFLFSTVERRALLAHQREVVERYRSRSEHLGNLRQDNNTDDYLNVSMWYLYFLDDEREDWARRLVGPTLRALGKLDG